MATSLTRKGLIAASDKVIIAAKPELEAIRLFATDFSVDAAKKYDVITTKVLTAKAADFAKDTQNFAKGTNAIKFADIRLTEHKISSYLLDDLDVLEDELSPVWDRLAPSSGAAISRAVVEKLMSLFTYDKADAQKTVSGTGLSKFVGIRTQTVEAGFSPSDCVLLLDPATYAELLVALPASVIGNGGVISTAQIGQFLGFKAVLSSPNASKASGASAEKGVGFVVPSGAVGIAGRYFAPQKGVVGDLIEAGSTVDETTGLVFGSRVVQDAGNGEVTWSVNALFGCALMKQTIESEANGAPGFLQLVTA